MFLNKDNWPVYIEPTPWKKSFEPNYIPDKKFNEPTKKNK